MKRFFNCIVILLFMFIIMPSVNAETSVILKDLKYADGSEVDTKILYGMGSGAPGFSFPKSHIFSSSDYSFIDGSKIEDGLTIKLTLDEDDSEPVNDDTVYNVKVKFDEVTAESEYTLFESTLTGKELKEGKVINLNTSGIELDNNYYLSTSIANVEDDEDYIPCWAHEQWADYYDFYIGNKYSYRLNAYINDDFGLSSYNGGVNLKGFYNGFDSFTLSFEILFKEDNSVYTLKEYYCEDTDGGGYVSSEDECTLNATKENAVPYTEYFKHVVDEDLYNSTFKDVDYIRYEIYRDGNKVTSKTYKLDHEYDAFVQFIKYSFTDKYGNDITNSGVAASKELKFNLKGYNFDEDTVYDVSIFEMGISIDQLPIVKYTGKELNDGITVDVKVKNTKRTGVFLEVIEEGLDENYGEGYYSAEETRYFDVNAVDDAFKTYSVKNLVTEGIAYNTVKLTYDEVEGATGYQIYRSTKKSSGYKLIGTSDTTEFTDGAASLKYTYYYKVRAYYDDGDSKVYSKYSSYKSGKSVLLKPNVTVSSYNYNTIKVSYDKVEGATGYNIYRATSKNGKYSLIKTTTSLSYLDKSRTTGKTYYYKVKAYRTISGTKYYSSYSSYKSTYSRVGTPIVSVTSYDYDSVKVAITKKPLGASGYEIYRSLTGEDDSWERLTRTTKTTYYNNSLTTGRTYYYKIRAYRTVNGTRKYGNYTEVFEVVPKINKPEMSAMSMDKAIFVGLKEDYVPGASSYEIYEVINGEKHLLVDDEYGSYWHEDLNLGDVHTYVMRAYADNSLGRQYSDFTDEYTITVRPSWVDVYITNEVFHTHNLEILVYETLNKNDNYNIKVYRSLSKTGGWEIIYDGKCESIDDWGTCNLELESTDLHMNKTYYYKALLTIDGVEGMTAHPNFGECISEAKASVTPELSILPYEFNKVILGQDYDDEIDGYQVYRATSKSGKYTKVYDGPDNVTTLTPGFKKGYYYKVRYYKYYDGKKVYSPYSTPKYLKTGVKALDDYPVRLDGDYGDTSIKSVSFSYKRTSGNYVYYTMKINFNYTYSTKKMKNYYTVKFLDWGTDLVYTWNLYHTVPKGTKRNYSETFDIKLPKDAVYFYFE